MDNYFITQNRRNTRSLKWDSVENDVLPMWLADMDFKCPPQILAALQNIIHHGILGYPLITEEYFTAVVDWFKTQYFSIITSENILPVSGIIPALRAIIEEFSLEQDYIIIQPPVYYPFMEVIEDSNRAILSNPLICNNLGYYTMDIDHLDSLKKLRPKLLILCSPHNPVGRIWTRSELTEIRQFCYEQNILLVVDEIHADLILPDYEFTSFASLPKSEFTNYIILSSPTKTFNFAGLRGGNVIVFNEIIRNALIKRFNRSGINKINSFYIEAATIGYNYCKNWLQLLIKNLYKNYCYVTNFVKQHIPQLIVAPLEATYLVWINYQRLNISESIFITSLSQYLIVSEGSKFGIEGQGWIRLNIACSTENIKASMEILKKTVRSFM